MKPLYIFDLDGTLANIEHRRHLVAGKKKPRWDEFYLACVDDKPNMPVIKILNNLKPSSDILIFSGRSALVYIETQAWLSKFVDSPHIPILTTIQMRPLFDYTPDQILKKQWYDELSKSDKDRLVCVFDDRQKVVDMWRSIGVTCLQVARGDF